VTGGLISRLVMVITVVISTTSVAQEVPAPASAPDPNPDGPGDDLEEVEEALRVLSDAGVPPTREELARFLDEAENEKPNGSWPGFPFQVHGSVQIRVGHYQFEGLDHYGKFALETRWLRVRARIREYRSGLRESTGTVEAGGEAIELRVGELGLVQGYGLLIGAPGRGSSLAADSGFASRIERLVTWLGTADSRSLSGFAGRAGYGNWSLRFLNGRPGKAAGNPNVRTSVVQLGCHRRGWRISVSGLSGNLERGVSLAGGIKGKALFGSFETLAWKVAPGIPATGAAVLHVGWNPAKGSGLEGLLAFADLAGAPGMASRPAVLPGWDGRGLALRGFTRTSSGLALRAMVHLGRNLDRGGVRSRKEKFLIDLQAGKKMSPLVDLAVRYRRTDLRAWHWSERYPWQPPHVEGAQRRTIISAQVVLERSGMRGRLLVRSYGLDNESGTGRRSLISLTGRYPVGQAWKLRGAWVTAWGDPVDLVSAISPLPTLVLPRHWGRWRSETVLGLEWFGGGARVQAAVSWRHPEPESGERPVQTIWVEAKVHW